MNNLFDADADGYIPAAELAKQMGTSELKVIRKVNNAIRKGYIVNVNYNAAQKAFLLSDTLQGPGPDHQQQSVRRRQLPYLRCRAEDPREHPGHMPVLRKDSRRAVLRGRAGEIIGLFLIELMQRSPVGGRCFWGDGFRDAGRMQNKHWRTTQKCHCRFSAAKRTNRH